MAGQQNKKSVPAEKSKLQRDLLLGFVKIHVLYHAAQEAIYGAGISAELEAHGYHLSWGTLYPLLHNLEAAGFLAREEQVVDGKVRKYYRITELGREALDEARNKAVELVREISGFDSVPVGCGGPAAGKV
ncbi:MAG TPA: PadR family transcriptional regulator [Streptosporangiaceae bacterium]